jgi:hypothetical protein
MKTRILILALCAVIALSATPAMAYVQNGSWTGPGEFPVTQWQEAYWGGGEGQAGNAVSAWGYGNAGLPGNYPVWKLENAVLSSVTEIGTLKYSTVYSGGILNLYEAGPWWVGADTGGYVTISNVTLTNITQKYVDGSMEFDITGSGIYGSQLVTISAHYNKGTPMGPFTLSGTNPNTGLTGSAPTVFAALNSASVTVTPIPAAVWLLGSGLVGLVAIRRKRTK